MSEATRRPDGRARRGQRDARGRRAHRRRPRARRGGADPGRRGRAGERAARRLRRLRGLAPCGRRPPARPDGRAAARRRASPRTATCSRAARSTAVEDMLALEHDRRADRLDASRGDVGLAAQAGPARRDPEGSRVTARSTHVVADVARRTGRPTCSWSPTRPCSASRCSTGSARGPRRARRLPPRQPAERPGRRASTPRPSAACARRSRRCASEGIEAHGQIAHPDPYTAAMQVVHDERVDEVIVSTFPGDPLRLAPPRPRRAPSHGRGRARWSTSSTEPAAVAMAGSERARRDRCTTTASTTGRRPRTRARGSTRRRSGCSSSSPRRRCSSARSSRRTSSSASSTPTRPRYVAARAVRVPRLRRRREHGDPRHLELHDPLGDAVDQARRPERAQGRARRSRSCSASRSCSRR